MLLGDRDLALLPAFSELAQQGQHGAVEHGVEREVGEQPIERGVRGCVIEPPDCLAQLDRHSLQWRRRRGRRLRERLAGRLGRGDARRQQLAHPSHPAHVRARVEPIAALGPRRSEQAVAALPGP